MHHAGDFARQGLLKRAERRVFALLLSEFCDFLPGEEGEDLDVLLRVGIADIQPELVEFIGRGAGRVEPYVARFGLAEFAAVGLGDERTGQRESLAAGLAPDEFRAGGDVAPLVGSAHLQPAVPGDVQGVEVESLDQLVGEFGERHAVARFARKPFLDRILGHHIIDGDVLAHVADEIQKRHVLHPGVVVDEFRGVRRVGIEIQEPGQLFFYALLVVEQFFLRKQVALLRFHGRVADHAGGAADQRDGLMPAALQVAQHHDAHQMSDVQRVGSRVDAHVRRGHALFQHFVRARHDVVNHAAPCEFLYEIHEYYVLSCSCRFSFQSPFSRISATSASTASAAGMWRRTTSRRWYSVTIPWFSPM